MAISAGMKFAQYAEKISDGMRDELYRRGVQITQVLRKTELEVLAGARNGIKYKSLPNRSSAPGEAPAAQSGKLRQEWDDITERQGNGHTSIVTSRITSTTPYAGYLEEGTERMAARSFVDKIIEKAEPEILEIARAPYGPYL
ncbi:hypothetical protein [Eubacterium sp. An3]|uniref:hypothetical protein n=1 Tax=Eubacterium sp. An3 TaxID=1965628 RepID=UPI000B38D8D6|nr:hypothetical protein [Eubacterium sp. An3]OUO26012.1 hypothetical protein B5F87_15730 [Eubacterium sp. An3]